MATPTTPAPPRPATAGGGARARLAIALFSVTLFLSAALMFAVQPMFAKLVLPLLGSTPAVWIAAMLFFQTALLLGYLYAHLTTRWLGARRQAALHLGLVLLPLLVLPIAVPDGWTPPVSSDPVAWLLALLAVAVGLPFFVVSTTAPLLQRWLSETDHPAAADPYFLYRASNLGSVVGLLGYPLAMEPALRLAVQGEVWAAGYVALIALVAACAVLVWRSGRAPAAATEDAETGGRPSARRRLRWVLLAFVPSSLMLGVTSFLTTDVAPVPLLWALPLTLYLASFVLVFSPGADADRLRRAAVVALPFVVLVLGALIALGISSPLLPIAVLHLVGFFVAAVACHGELARDRPPAAWLTEFYLLLAVGGALGGLFNAIVAPQLFVWFLEYPLALVLAAACMPVRPGRVPPTPLTPWLDAVLPFAIFVTVFGGLSLAGLASEDYEVAAESLVLGLAAGIVLNFVRRPVRFALGVAAILAAAGLQYFGAQDAIHRERDFFGAYTVESDGDRHDLLHGTTTHGAQRSDPPLRTEPLTYYSRGGPIGRLINAMPARLTRRTGVIGLGAGTMACLASRGDRWTFFEIDPAIERIARDPRLFTYLRDCPGRFDVVLGDGRLSIARRRDREFGLLVADAFSSDAIPTHLLTREALRTYRAKLMRGGVVAFHVSNRYLDLPPVLGRLAADARMTCRVEDHVPTPQAGAAGAEPSTWVALAARREDFGPLAVDSRWRPCPASGRVWTDDYSNVLDAL